MNDQESVQSVIKTITLLEAIAYKYEMGVTELAEKVGGTKSTVFRFLNTLKKLGYIRQNPENELYSLTLKIFEIGSIVLDRIDVRTIALPFMEDLARVTKETIHLATLDHDKVVYLHKINSSQSLRVEMMSRIGHSTPIYCTGVGKALLAFQPEDTRKKFLLNKKFQQFTPSTITNIATLKKELQKIRKQGYSLDIEEHEIGVCCVASPIFDLAKNIIASISISAPYVRMDSDRIKKLSQIIVKASNDISKILGYKGVPSINN